MRPLIELAQSISRQATMELNVLKHSQVAGFLFELRAFRSLPDPRLYAGRSSADLALLDPRHDAVTPETRRRLAREIEEAARSAPGQ